jgi:23S rRNA (pseudouridine1915-N3)-methyltransferase
MKFSEITSEEWEELKPYLDTCLLPVTGMIGAEAPHEATAWLERLRDMLDLVEIPFKGRVVTYPAWHYIGSRQQLDQMVQEWCASMKRTGFRYVVAVTADPGLRLASPAIDLWLQPNQDGSLPQQSYVADEIRKLWSGEHT